MRRRTLIAGALAACVAPQARAAVHPVEAWTAYEDRLGHRLGDAGGGTFDVGAARALLDMSNAARSEAGSPSVAWDDALAQTAQAHAGDLAQRSYVEHLSPEGFDPTDRLGLVARRTLGSTSENIAYHAGGRRAEPARLMATWQASPAHWGNLLRPRYGQAGFGVVRTADRVYAVGLYAQLDGVLPADLPFRLTDPGVVQTILERMPDGAPRFWLQGQAALPQAGANVVRLRVRRLGATRDDSIYGPIFVLG